MFKVTCGNQKKMEFKFVLFFFTFSGKSRQKADRELGDTEKRVLVLGAGFVSAPLVEYLHREKNIAIIVGKQTIPTRRNTMNNL